MKLYLALFLAISILVTACTTQQQQTYNVLLVADGRERGWQVDEPITVQEFLDQVGIEIGPLDRMVPEPWTQIFDGIRITIRRVTEEEYCEDTDIPYGRRTEVVDGLEVSQRPPIAQTGKNGVEEICYRVRVEDGVRQEPVIISRTVKVEPQDEVVLVPPSEDLEPVTVNGKLLYINRNNAWIMDGSNRARRPLTVQGQLDGRVFSVSDNGRMLLFTQRTTDDNTGQSNQLWLINDLTSENPQPIPLAVQDVLYADWVRGKDSTIAYSTFEPSEASPGWRALNDLWEIRIDPNTGDQINVDQILESSCGGPYCWWGNGYEWSPDGNRLAWIRADGIGLVDFENNTLGPYLVEYTALAPNIGDWSWRATASWSPDGNLLATTVHGPPVGSERPANSPVFNVAVVAADGSFSVDVVNRAGIWASPVFSPELENVDNPYPQGYLAYFRAREWQSSISGEYDLIIADRDGSNARVAYPPSSSAPGLDDQDLQLAWRPDGRQLAFLYQGNLWAVDVESNVAFQLTQDGGASSPVWTR